MVRLASESAWRALLDRISLGKLKIDDEKARVVTLLPVMRSRAALPKRPRASIRCLTIDPHDRDRGVMVDVLCCLGY